MNYYRRYVGDYLRDTARLSLLEHGAYTLLLDYYYAEERPIPLDAAEVYRMVRAQSEQERQAIDKILTGFFIKQSDGYRHKRVDHEISVSQQARKNGKRGGRPITGILTGLETTEVTESLTEQVAGSGHPPTTILQPPSSSLQPPEKEKSKHWAEGPPLPTNIPYREITALYNSIMVKLPKVRFVNNDRRKAIKAAWVENKKWQTLEFWRCYFEECQEDDFRNGTGPYRGEFSNWTPDFDYLIRKKVVTKVYEAAMHRAEAA
mgnify:CR=1 FL=1